MDIQSLLFDRSAGWTASKAKQWAKSHGYKHGKVHVTDQYVRIRQFDPKGLKVKRTITLGRGIRAVVAREEDMAAKRKRSSKKSAAKTTRRRASRRTRETPVAATEAKRPRRRRPARRAREEARRPRRRSAPASGQMMEASRRRRPRRRRAAVREEAWAGNRPGHRKAAKKGWERRKRRKPARRRRARESGVVAEARRPRRRRARRSREFAYEEARRPRRRRARRSRARETVMEARRPRRRRSYGRKHGLRMFEARGGSGRGMQAAELAVAVVAGGLGFVLADALDRFLATYDPAATGAKPTDKFTSDGAGTLANTLNVSATPSLYRVGAAAGLTILPVVGAVFVDHPFLRSSLEGLAVGGGVKLFSLLWNNVLMPMLAPKDTSTAGLQKSIIARLYPAEIAAKINLDAKQTSASGVAFGALSQPPAGYQQPAAASPQAGVGAPPADVGPFALSGSSPYPDAAQALRKEAGMGGPGGNFPSLQNVWGTGEYPTAQQALGVGADQAMSDMTKTVAQVLPGLHPVQAMQAATEAAKRPHDIPGALMIVFPHVPANILMECARQLHPHVARLHAAAPGAPAAPATPAAPAAPPATSAPQSPPPSGVTGVSQPPAYQPGPASTPGPGPQPLDKECGCGVGDDNQFLGFIGDGEEKDPLYSNRAA